MSDPFVAEIRIFPFNFAPKGWARCDGQLLPISQNTALFSLLGTFYGGDGKSNFALPDLQGSAPIHQGQGQGLSEYFLGQTGGSQFVTLLQSEMPVHTHTLGGSSFEDQGNLQVGSPTRILASSGNGQAYNALAAGPPQLAPEALAIAGGSLPHNNMMPYLTFNYCIAMQGSIPTAPVIWADSLAEVPIRVPIRVRDMQDARIA